jgi:hypothetical protein
MQPAVFLLLITFLAAFAGSAAAQSTAPPPWYERLQFGGDFRSRYEGFSREGDPARHRGRMRLRLRLDAAVNEDVRVQVQVASGDPGTPVSTNQTFTGFFQPKPLNLDRAFLAYSPQAASALTLGLGKFPAPQVTTQLTFDDDLNYEGAWEQVSWEPRGGLTIRLLALQAIVNERSATPDSYLIGGYGEVSAGIGPHRLAISLANYGWRGEDQIAVAAASGGLDSVLTNAVRRNAAGAVVGFDSGFNVVDLIAEARFQTGRTGYPVRLLWELARNTRAASARDGGLWLEAAYGAPRATGTWGAGYTYGRIEQDVSPSVFVFSDIPGTNLAMHMIDASYVVRTGRILDATLHLTKSLVPDLTNRPDPWLKRLHLAAVVRF